MRNSKYSITPLSIKEFKEAYSVSDSMIKDEYTEYIETNTRIHHYNGLTLSEWLLRELTKDMK